MIFFEAVTTYGDLQLDKVLFEFDRIPIVFVCKNNQHKLFLCQCTDVISQYSWIMVEISANHLIEVLEDHITILDAFRKSKHDIILCDYIGGKMQYREKKYCDIPPEELPQGDEYLENPNMQNYIKELQKPVERIAILVNRKKENVEQGDISLCNWDANNKVLTFQLPKIGENQKNKMFEREDIFFFKKRFIQYDCVYQKKREEKFFEICYDMKIKTDSLKGEVYL